MAHCSLHSTCTACLYEHGIDARVVVMGSSGVGKTSLLRQYTQNQFDDTPRSVPTTAPSFVTKKVHVGGTKVRLQLWDTPGRASFRTMAPMYYRDADAALLLYDSSDPSTCDDIRDWLEELKNNAPDILIYVVGVKAEIHDQTQITPALAHRLVRSWFPPTKQTPAPPPTPTQKSSSFSSYFRLPFRSLSASFSQNQNKSAPSSPYIPTTRSPKPISTPPALSASIIQRYGTNHRSLVQMRRTQSELPPNTISDSLSSQSTRSLQHSRSLSSLHSEPGVQQLARSLDYSHYRDAEDDDESHSLPNRVEFFECALQDRIGINDLFHHLLQGIVGTRAQQNGGKYDPANFDSPGKTVTRMRERKSSPSPPSTPSPSEKLTYSTRNREKKQDQDCPVTLSPIYPSLLTPSYWENSNDHVHCNL